MAFCHAVGRGKTQLIVDGTIDLLFRTQDDSWRIIDYKFTDEPAAMLKKKYSLQLNLYRLALGRFQKGSEPVIHSSLVVVGRDGVKTIDIPEDPTCLATAVQAAEALDTLFKVDMP
jgi:RecB family exonuclease